ncbi:hypothetical protein PROFUN_14655 [Planoprotostelium fungivorum]|uniref:Uncharacterized protein n=1 Tax=Planoprotostelium fungivorum TaxID=1890364 RepID=A0A2P6MMT7_9EUKA|nr:hypothetical protein PROFUN_14655 [Planoprotostelium fungivorum]
MNGPDDGSKGSLKIKIKNPNLISPTPISHGTATTSTINAPTITSLPIPDQSVAGIGPLFQKALQCTQEQLDSWKDGDLQNLKGEMDSMCKAFKEYQLNLTAQLNVVENWRTGAIGVEGISSNGENNTHNGSGKSVPSPMISKTPARKGKSKDKGQSKKTTNKKPTKRTEDSPVTSDSEKGEREKNEELMKSDPAVREEDIHNSSEDEILDIDDTESADGKKGSRASSVDEKNQSISAGKGKRQKSANFRKGKNDKKKKGKDDYTDEEEDSEDEDLLFKASELLNPPKNNFWADRALFCILHRGRSSLHLPTAGRTAEDNIMPSNKQENDSSKPIISCGEVTQRLLAALIDEKVISFEMTENQGSTLDHILREDDEAARVQSTTWYTTKDVCPFSTESEYLPLHVPPTYDYSFGRMLALEDRIKLELRSIGLLDDEDLDIDTLHREDDEICSELRKLQHQLKDRMRINNNVRTKLAALVSKRMEQEEQERKEKEANRILEGQYKKKVKKRARMGRKGKGEVT